MTEAMQIDYSQSSGSRSQQSSGSLDFCPASASSPPSSDSVAAVRRKRRLAAAKRLEAHLFAAERAIDDALSAVARLNAFMPEARQDARVAAAFGHEAIVGGVAALGSVIDARSIIVGVHAELDKLRSSLDLPALAFGGGDVKPWPR